MTHTKCVYQEIVLDFVYVPGARLVLWRKKNTREIVQEVNLLTSQAHVTEFFQDAVSSGSRFSKLEADAGRERFHRSAAS